MAEEIIKNLKNKKDHTESLQNGLGINLSKAQSDRSSLQQIC